MRTGALVISLLFLTFTAFSAEVGLKTITIDGEKAYVLEAGAFPKESSALQLKLKLSALFKQPLTIDYETNRKLFVVKMGPIKNLEQAKELQKLLGNDTPKSVSTPIASNSKTTNSGTAPSADSTKKLWNLRGADIRAVIAEVSRVTGKNFIIDPRVQGKISIVASTPMSDKELYQVFLSMLQVSGYAAIPSGDVIKIVPNIDAKTISPDYEYDLKSPPRGDDMLVEVIPVKYVPSEQLVPVLRPLMPQWSSVSAYAPSNMLILSGRASNIRKLASIIKQVDSSTSNGIDIVPLHFALAMDVVATLKDLMKTQPGSTVHSQTMLAADDRSNAILISGNKTERIRLRLLISRLDRQHPNGTNSNTQVIYLNYLRAEDLVPILAGIAQANFSGNVGTTIGTITRPELDSTNPASSLVSNNSSSSSSSNSSSGNNPFGQGGQSGNPAATPNTTGSTTQNEGSTKPTVQIIAEPNTNSIILNAPVSLIRTLKAVINQLDIKPAQLLIEALVAEVDESDINSLGIEWGTDRQTGNPASFSPGFAIINSKTSIDDFQAQIYALARARKANILSTPSVVVLDNRQAKILVGKQVSVASTTYPNNAGGTTTASPYVTFDRVNVALHLYVRPQITRGQGIQLQIDQGNDTLDPSTTLNTDNPTFKISSIVTAVHVESGDIVVLGGLTQDSLANDDNKLPIIGDIPGVGRLFQHNIRNREKRVLMVFIRPIILRNPRDSFSVTGGKYNDLREYQLDSLRQQESFHQSDDEIVLPALSGAELPKPFNRAIKQVVITPMPTK
ncbi:GspD family T2SS secretin variant LspD [Legionella sp. 16cNR16C]|uniref:GspD family T2SS secretin variant LspD n=1 Tax=Legionella sp. 16cNR16C TaxID=2905656 RepID=UPI001E315C6A|nr:GspD family T2SS secretin variant LspD [Legionella sp. 16cNR16C]MCE3044100.1 GspD family T2SS secretin variant LspD [Legionella sp. 16cNR16C]